jgi:uncharacterized membrane protein
MSSPSFSTPPAQRALTQTFNVDLNRSAAARVTSIDVVRGVVMVLMAIDHVRVYAGVPAGGPTPGVFFTRWITHFVAPAFCFLAGTSAWLHGRKLGNSRALSRFLLTRGIWLVFLELTLLRFAWTFNFDYSHYMLAGVIWMLGWCMVMMAGIIRLPMPIIASFGVVIIAGHNILDLYSRSIIPVLETSRWASVAQVLYYGGTVPLGPDGPPLEVLYSLVPWIGVMAAGYAYGAWITRRPDARRQINFVLGCGCVLLFVLLRGMDLYGDPRPWSPKPQPQVAAQTNAQVRTNTPAPAVKQNAAPAPAPTRPNANATTSAASPPAQAVPPSPTPRKVQVRPPAYIRFLNTTKYPASLLFLLMTLGPMFIALALVDQARGPLSRVLETYGRVPMFYYLLHIPLIHLLALGVALLRTPSAIGWLFANHPMSPPPSPPGYMWSLPLLYLVWALAIAILYVPCRWYAKVRKQSGHRWLSYL